MPHWVATGVIALAGFAGTWLLQQAFGSRTVSGGTFLLWLAAGAALFIVAAAWQYRRYVSGTDSLSAHEVPAHEPRWARFLSRSTLAAPLWLGVRLFLAYAWWDAGSHKVVDHKWVGTGEALQAYWTRAVTPAASGAAPAAYEFYRNFLQLLLDAGAYTWFAKLITFGELAVGLGLALGALTGFAALGGILMNASFLFAGAVSSNPLLLLLEVLLIWAWRAAGWLGLDRFLLPLLGVPGSPREARSVRVESARTRAA